MDKDSIGGIQTKNSRQFEKKTRRPKQQKRQTLNFLTSIHAELPSLCRKFLNIFKKLQYSLISWHYCTSLQSLHNVYSSSSIWRNGFLLLYEIFKFKVYTVSSVLLTFVSIVEAYATILDPVKQIFEDNLMVCLSQDNKSSCTQYVNSSIHGLIELNERLYPALKGFRGSYDYKMISRINPFWLTFEPPSDASYYVMGTLYMIIFVFGVTGNGLVIYMFARCRALRTNSNILVFNLAISDFMIVVKSPVAGYNNFMRGPALGDWGCRLYGFMGGFSGCASIGLLTVISLDRYSVVVNPLGPLRFNNKTKSFYCLLLLAWFEAFFFSIIPLLEVGLSVYVPEGYLTTCSFDYLDRTMPARIFMFIFFVFAWCLPLLSIFYCYFHILKAVFISKNIQSNHNKHKTEVRLAFIVLMVIGLWFLAWTPYSIVAMAGVFGMENYLTPTRSMIPALFCKTAACLNPFLYTISHKRFRHELQRLFGKRKPIFQYSMTRSSILTRSSSRIQHRVAYSTAGACSDTHRNNLKCNSFQHNEVARIFHHRRSLVVSSEEANIFVLDLDKNSKPHPLETNF